MNAKRADRLATIIFYAIAGFIVLLLAGLFGYILVNGVSHISWKFITSPPQSFRAGGGIGPQLFNSFYLLILTMIISVPLALGAGIYMSEYAKKNIFTDILRTVIEVLSSLPSIVVGLFGFLFFVIYMGWGFSILTGALVLTIFNLPLMVRVVETSLQGVPDAQREAGLALGISKWETIKKFFFQLLFQVLLQELFLLLEGCSVNSCTYLYSGDEYANSRHFKLESIQSNITA